MSKESIENIYQLLIASYSLRDSTRKMYTKELANFQETFCGNMKSPGLVKIVSVENKMIHIPSFSNK